MMRHSEPSENSQSKHCQCPAKKDMHERLSAMSLRDTNRVLPGHQRPCQTNCSQADAHISQRKHRGQPIMAADCEN